MTPPRLVDEIADILASNPTQEQLLAFHPSEAVQRHARKLLIKASEGTLSSKEQGELGQFEQAELLMRLVKARIYASTPK